LIFFEKKLKWDYMKKDIHPKYYKKVPVRCACGNTFEVASSKPHIETEVCFKCHPFYTKQEKIFDTAGRVEKFKKKLEISEAIKKKRKK
jgi:large subunit ribosomal protein L31